MASPSILGQRCREARTARGWTQERLAKESVITAAGSTMPSL